MWGGSRKIWAGSDNAVRGTWEGRTNQGHSKAGSFLRPTGTVVSGSRLAGSAHFCTHVLDWPRKEAVGRRWVSPVNLLQYASCSAKQDSWSALKTNRLVTAEACAENWHQNVQKKQNAKAISGLPLRTAKQS